MRALPLVAALGPDWLDPLTILDAAGPYAFWTAVLIVFAECGLLIGFFLPGDSLLFVVGLLIAGGSIGLPGGIATACAVLTVAALLGNLTGYAIGRRAGPTVFNRPDSRLFKAEYVDKTAAFFDRYGPRAVVLARFVPIVRTFITVMAGVGRMDPRRYFAYSTLGAVLWATGVTLLGFWLGNVAFVRDHIEPILLLIVAVSLVPVAVELLRARSQRRDERYDEEYERQRVYREDVRGERD